MNDGRSTTARHDTEPLSFAEVRQILMLLDGCVDGEIDVRTGALRVRIRRTGPVRSAATGRADRAHAEASETAMTLTAPAAGRLYWIDPPAGSHLVAGQAYCRVDAAGRTTRFDAPRSGTVAVLLVADGSFVEYGQPILLLAQTAARSGS